MPFLINDITTYVLNPVLFQRDKYLQLIKITKIESQ